MNNGRQEYLSPLQSRDKWSGSRIFDARREHICRHKHLASLGQIKLDNDPSQQCPGSLLLYYYTVEEGCLLTDLTDRNYNKKEIRLLDRQKQEK